MWWISVGSFQCAYVTFISSVWVDGNISLKLKHFVDDNSYLMVVSCLLIHIAIFDMCMVGEFAHSLSYQSSSMIVQA